MKNIRRQILTIILTERCNLSCTYCYESNKSSRSIDVTTAKNAIKNAFADEHFDELEIDFFGGEPLLEFDKITELTTWLWSSNWRKPYVCFAITNGTLVHGKIKAWAKENKHRFILGLSLDGTPEMHNTNRSNSFASIDIDFFRETWPLQTVKMTISKETLPNLSSGIKYIHSRGLSPVCTCAFGINWEKEDIDIFSREMQKLAIFYIKNPHIEPSNIISMPIQYAFSSQNIQNYCGAGKNLSCIDVDGNIYPCQTFTPLSCGKEKSESHETFIRLRDAVNNKNGNCANCGILHICHTCYGLNYIQYGDPFTRGDMNCEFSKVRAKASAFLLGKMLANKHKKYAMTQKLSQEEIQRTINSITIINGWDSIQI